MRRHGPVIAHCTDSEDLPLCLLTYLLTNPNSSHMMTSPCDKFTAWSERWIQKVSKVSSPNFTYSYRNYSFSCIYATEELAHMATVRFPVYTLTLNSTHAKITWQEVNTVHSSLPSPIPNLNFGVWRLHNGRNQFTGFRVSRLPPVKCGCVDADVKHVNCGHMMRILPADDMVRVRARFRFRQNTSSVII